MQTGRPNRTGVISLVAILTLVWGTTWVVFPVAVQEVSVWTFRAICVLGAGALLLLIARIRGLSLYVPKRERVPLALAGMTYLVIWNVGSASAAVLLPSGQAAMLGYTMPIWSSLLAWIFLGEKPTLRVVASLLLASLGVGFLVYAGRITFESAPLGFAIGLTAGLGWAVGTTILKKSAITVNPLTSTAWQLMIAGVPLTVASFVLGTRAAFVPSWTSILAIGYVTIFPMAVGNVVWFYILSVMPAMISSLTIVMVPIVAMLTGTLVRGEPLGTLQIAAIICCMSAMALVLVARPVAARPIRTD